jgi:hypothetical protein
VSAAIEKEDATAALSFRSLDDQIAAALTQERLVAMLAGFFGVLGAARPRSAFGVTAYAVTSRRAEIDQDGARASARGSSRWSCAAWPGWSASASSWARACRRGRRPSPDAALRTRRQGSADVRRGRGADARRGAGRVAAGAPRVTIDPMRVLRTW